MRRDASELARRLAREAEAVCRHYLSNGKREGRYWLVAKGRNPTIVNGKEITREEPTEVTPDQKIAICNFTIRIQPK